MRQIRKILVVDRETSAEETRQILLSSGAVGSVDFCPTARKALKYIEQREFVFPEQLPDLVLLEIGLDDEEGVHFLDGFSTLNAELREKIHLVVLTSATEPGLQGIATNHPDVEEVVMKPITLEKIIDLQQKIWNSVKK